MNSKEIAHNYLTYLEKGQISKIVDLFSETGTVISPLYGTMPATDFYTALASDTSESILEFDGIFQEENTSRITLLFNYTWILKNHKTVQFKVVDLIEFNIENKIEKLTIIYDTVHSRAVLNELKNNTKI
ncbi:nuclear transport factor 2 family protein [Aquimarina algicola]|uniref:Nuclear transport factor 2 family protein n=1 Tax=Aquimarina algicola TaxID=2589995 RepID=A0A504JMX6_9FLAO|nr:nuclear transport factor 2 family protein [Aquimarina algicola]TPN89043.1 nuclear transport factor 2 family protein [Aquimarina algicola]